MLRNNRAVHSLTIGLFTILTVFTGSTAKSRGINDTWNEQQVQFSTGALRSLEQRLTPFLQERSTRRHARKKNAVSVTAPREPDLMLLAKAWSQLSPEFKSLYKSAARLPDSFSSYESPGGHFEILYTIEGFDRVDPTDGYGFTASDWRVRSEEANGVPDYIDETAFALDSCWSMEVERFNFIAPPPYKDENYTSDRYKIVVESQPDSYYGLTYLNDQSSPTGRGYISHISLRNNWPAEEWSGLGYDVRPIDGVRVTCAHEFFHAIQYAMTWHVLQDVWLDDFPLTWTEGCAVTMEELAFDSVNDYHQYARTYFDSPGVSFFDHSTSDVVYTNAILLLYIFYHAPSGRGIDFIRTMHFTNYTKRTPFHDNLRATSTSIGTQWVSLLHSFHTASFYTGIRADPARFIPDAAYFKIKKGKDIILPVTLSDRISSNSVDHQWLTQSKNQLDTLSILFKGAPEITGGFSTSNWALTLLVHKKDGADSLIPVTVDRDGKASQVVTPWTSLDEAVLIITNADPVITRDYTVAFNVDSIVISNKIDLFPNPVSLRRNKSTAYVSGHDISDIALYSVTGTLLWRLSTPSGTLLPGRQRYELVCKTKNGASLSPGTYSVIITRDELSGIKPQRSRKTLLITP